MLGAALGFKEGEAVGTSVGLNDGPEDGEILGDELFVGVSEGAELG